jgi:hypothetical protein
MATVRVRIVILTVRITPSVCPFNRMAHTANRIGIPCGSANNEEVPNYRLSRVELIMMLNRVNMKVTEDQSKVFEQVRAIKNWFNTVTHKINEGALIAVVMGTAQNESYISVISSEQQAKGDKMTLEDLKELEAVMYQHLCQTNGLTEEQDTEMTLAGCEGYCYQCEEQGHQADARPDGKLYCRNCSKQDHHERTCWLKEESKSK